MKFPYKLSKQRQSLLSPEDREIYEFEHSSFYSYNDKKRSYQNIIDENDINDENDILNEIIDDSIYDILIEQFLPDIDNAIRNALTENEYNEFIEYLNTNKQQIIESVNSPEFDNILNEGAEGHDMLYWLGDMGWIGKLAGIGLTAILVPFIGAFMAGKSKMAAKLLERYMNKLVEITDDGVYKKRSIFSFFNKSGGTTSGNQSRGCFRSIQEMTERQICTNTLVTGKACGLITDVDNVTNGDVINNSLYQTFYKNIVEPIDSVLQN